jgi:hypothetical protein
MNGSKKRSSYDFFPSVVDLVDAPSAIGIISIDKIDPDN